jgi:hypothetical protein
VLFRVVTGDADVAEAAEVEVSWVGGTTVVLPAGAGSAARACDARHSIPAHTQDFKNDPDLRIAGAVKYVFGSAAWIARETGQTGGCMAEVSTNLQVQKIGRDYSRVRANFKQLNNRSCLPYLFINSV